MRFEKQFWFGCATGIVTTVCLVVAIVGGAAWYIKGQMEEALGGDLPVPDFPSSDPPDADFEWKVTALDGFV